MKKFFKDHFSFLLSIAVLFTAFVPTLNAKELKSPFTKEEISDTPTHFRVEAYAISPDMQFAKNQAMMEAMKKMAVKMEQVKKKKISEKKGVKEIETIDATINNAKMINSKTFVNKDRTYTVWVVIELAK